MLAQKLKVLVLRDDCARHHVQEIRSKDALESRRIVLHVQPPVFQGQQLLFRVFS
jgi:hypothetical protein